ncbi:4808_t:CDS:2, partial [Acaulospora morrowiae]
RQILRNFLEEFVLVQLKSMTLSLTHSNLQAITTPITPNNSHDYLCFSPNRLYDLRLSQVSSQQDPFSRDLGLAEIDITMLSTSREIFNIDSVQHFTNTLYLGIDILVLCEYLRNWKGVEEFEMKHTDEFKFKITSQSNFIRIPEAMKSSFNETNNLDVSALPLPSIFGGIVPEPPVYKPLKCDPASIILPYHKFPHTLEETNKNLRNLKKKLEEKLIQDIRYNEEPVKNFTHTSLNTPDTFCSPTDPLDIDNFISNIANEFICDNGNSSDISQGDQYHRDELLTFDSPQAILRLDGQIIS